MPVPQRDFLFFDLDGTVADSGAGITSALNEVFAAVAAAPLTADEVRLIIGPPFQQTMPVLLENRGIHTSRSDEFIHEYRRIYREHHLPYTPSIPGMTGVLETLSDHWHLSIVTAKPKQQAVVAVRALGHEGRMVTVVGPDNDAPMPKARLLERAIVEEAERTGSVPDLGRCWMIGDRHHDVDAAVEVGTGSVGVLWGFGDRDELSGAGATHIVSDPSELLELFLPRHDRDSSS